MYTYGWNRQRPDFRDKLYLPTPLVVPDNVDLTPQMPPVYDQGQLGSCTANSLAAALQFLQVKENLKWRFTPSRLFIYYNERLIEGTVNQDAGANLRDGIKAINKYGVCPEDGDSSWKWPYSDGPLTFQQKPSQACYKDAVLHKALNYAQVPQTLAGLTSVLVEGYPVAFGITVYDSFEGEREAETGTIPLPGNSESVQGGHAILLVGYDHSKAQFKFRNSWGTRWGNAGYGTLPFHYVLSPGLASDFWVVKLTK